MEEEMEMETEMEMEEEVAPVVPFILELKGMHCSSIWRDKSDSLSRQGAAASVCASISGLENGEERVSAMVRCFRSVGVHK